MSTIRSMTPQALKTQAYYRLVKRKAALERAVAAGDTVAGVMLLELLPIFLVKHEKELKRQEQLQQWRATRPWLFTPVVATG